MAVYVAILGVLVIIAGIVFSRPSDKKINLIKLLYGGCFVSFGVFLLFWASLVNVKNGYLGLVNLNGTIQSEILNDGWHLVNPIAKVIQLDERTQYDVIARKQSVNSTADPETIDIVSADGSVIRVGLKIAYHIVPEDAAHLYMESGLAYSDKIVEPVAKSLLNKDVQKLATNASDKEELQASLDREIKSELRKHGLKVDKIIVSSVVIGKGIPDIKEPVLLVNNTNTAASIVIERKEPVVAVKAVTKTRLMQTLAQRDVYAAIPAYSKPQLKLAEKSDIDNIIVENEIISSKAKAISTVNNGDKTISEVVFADCKPMDERSFGTVKKMIQSTGNNTFQKLTVAEKVISANCFTSEQVSDFVNLLPTEDSRLEFAKQAYLKTVDRRQYYKVANTFDKKSQRQLGKYIMRLMHRTGGPRSNNEIQAVLSPVENESLYTANKAMDEQSFEACKKIISSRATEEIMILTAMKMADCNCFTTLQVLEIVKLLPSASAKLAFAKEAFRKTTDRQMFARVAEHLDSNSRKMLDDYVVTLYASK